MSADETTWAYTGRRYTMYRFPGAVESGIKELNKPDNWHVLAAWVEDAVWMAGCVLLCVLGSYWFYPLAALLIGARQRGLSTLLHDCAHGVGIANRTLQMTVGTVLTAYPIFQQHYAYKVSHVYTHHPRLGSPDLDPDLRFFIEQGAYRRSATGSYVRRVVLMPLLGSQTWGYLRYLIRNRYRVLKGAEKPSTAANPVQRRKKLLDRIGFWGFWATVVGFAWYGGWLTGLLLFWVIPYLTSFQILGWYIELSEHTPLVRDSAVDLYMTRNRKSRLWERLLTGIHNDHYHLEHHLDPRTPFYNLAKAREIRMNDPEYAAVDVQFGGLFHRGPAGQQSAISAIVRSMTTTEESARVDA
ncbi:fatty acid desaturase family protein [Streptomyces sioyaensis]|uniref:fatty acid desaturase family protein n=1 Tax=Streptomyces sioyaensis TaxID=67364 RepID=UPI001F41EB28|nr:fatty acid desaturase family protein [Streptomyces sioyaensis]